ncbi:MAG: repressor LexA [Rhodobiaceae bacterium]|jgi:repressor LexA|nr:repressor LexA [Rhodobiaceae bacterium]|tara:strand:- start:4429 stop:5109 length:681 start_codon:yes stop_codon:yes gene_type:complete
MLTRKQNELLIFIQQNLRETGIAPSYEEMKEALDLRSKSGIHRLINALEERGFIRRLAHRARAIEIIRFPNASKINLAPSFKPKIIDGEQDSDLFSLGEEIFEIRMMGKIAAGTPIAAIEYEKNKISVPSNMIGVGDHYALEIEGDSMIGAGILDKDKAIIRKTDNATSGQIVVALIDGEEATLKRLRKKGNTIALEPANSSYETKIYGPERVQIQGILVGILRSY